MERIKLSPRLQAIAELVPKGSSVVDVGTDHGYIPVWLAQTGEYGPITAGDINEGPLRNARLSAEEYDVSHQIRFELCSGLSFPSSEAHRTVIIAGMGGELIVSILSAAEWTKSDTTLILQPNSKIDILSKWLNENGYHVQYVRLVRDSGKIYQILVVNGDNPRKKLQGIEFLVNPLYLELRDPLLPDYLDVLIGKYSHAVDGMRHGHDRGHLEETEKILAELNELRKETVSWSL